MALERQLNGNGFNQQPLNDLLGAVRCGHCDQIPAQCVWAALVTKDFSTHKWMRKAWSLEKSPVGTTIVPMTLNVVLDALSLKCVQHIVDHWSNDAVDNLQAIETAQRIPDQPEFAPRRVYIRHADPKRKCCWGLRERKSGTKRRVWPLGAHEVTEKIRNKNEVILEAHGNRKKVQLCIIDGHLSPEERGIAPKLQKYRGRVVLRGDIVEDDSGAFAVFTEQGSSASQTTAAKIMDVIAKFRAVSAYTSVEVEDAPKLLKIPKSECPEVWIRIPRTQMAEIMVQYGRPSCSS